VRACNNEVGEVVVVAAKLATITRCHQPAAGLPLYPARAAPTHLCDDHTPLELGVARNSRGQLLIFSSHPLAVATPVMRARQTDGRSGLQ